MKKDRFVIKGNYVRMGNLELLLMDKEPVEVKNRFSGDTAILEPVAVALLDFIKGCELTGQYGNKFDFALSTFRENWPDEYMTLLD